MFYLLQISSEERGPLFCDVRAREDIFQDA